MDLNRVGTNIDLSRDGTIMVYLGPGDQGGQLWLRHRDRLDATPLPGTAGAINPRFSPDGRQIAFSAGPTLELRVVGVDGGSSTTIAQGGSGATGGIAWSDDGWIYFDTVLGLSRIHPAGGDSAEVVTRIDQGHGEVGQAWPDVLPGGRWMIYRTRHSNAPEEFDIVAFDIKNRTRHTLTKGVFARRIAPGVIGVVRSDGTLLAARVDERTLTLKGAPTPILDGMRTKLLGSVDLAAAAGTLMYVRGVASTAPVSAVWVTRDGVIKPIQPPVLVSPPNNRGLALSPDGRRLVVDMVGPKSTDLWVKELPSGPFSRLTFDGLENIRPTWTPDGQYVLYILNRGTGITQVWRKKADGSAPPESVYATTRSVVEAFISHDGKWLVYRLVANPSADVYGIRLGQDTTPVPLLTSPYNEVAPTLSPDGRWLAYMSNESGSLEVYVRPFPATSSGRWQVSTNGGAAPRWSHSGKELFFVNGGDLMSAPVTATTTFSVGTPRKLFTGFGTQFLQAFTAYYDLSPDDSQFLLMGIAGQDSSGVALVTVENWLRDVHAKLSAAQP
jgi:eukaryotic-like serine/threonine-protein kinase